MALKLLIFDFDGTLVHTAPDIARAVNEFLGRYGHPPLAYEDILPEIGMGLRSIFQHFFPHTKGNPMVFESLMGEFIQDYERWHLNSPRLFDGAEDLLNTWPEKIAIISNKPEKYMKSILDHLNLSRHPWVDILGGDSLHVKKPDPLPFQQVLTKAGCSPQEALMIGDGEPDIRGAQSLGMRSVAVRFGYGDVVQLQNLGAWKTVGSYSELTLLVESLT